MGRAEQRLGFPTPGEEIQAPSLCAKHREVPWCREARAGGGGLHVLVLTRRLQHSSPSPESQMRNTQSSNIVQSKETSPCNPANLYGNTKPLLFRSAASPPILSVPSAGAG